MNLSAIIFNALATISGLAAAWFWFLSSLVPYPKELHGVAIGDAVGHAVIDTKPLLAAAQRTGKLNKWAAFLTGLAVLCGSVGNSLAVLSH